MTISQLKQTDFTPELNPGAFSKPEYCNIFYYM
jgi:hypothetical protein